MLDKRSELKDARIYKAHFLCNGTLLLLWLHLLSSPLPFITANSDPCNTPGISVVLGPLCSHRHFRVTFVQGITEVMPLSEKQEEVRTLKIEVAFIVSFPPLPEIG